ncbi:MAG: GTPase HflX [Firmicutes bacterium]|nr:GTPase HflX [Bacillota bacterium]
MYRAILVGVSFGEDITASMEELDSLAEAAYVEVLGQMVQPRERPDKATYIGKGKVEELAEMCANMEANTVIFNNELSGMQLRNLEDALGVTVLDRTILILDIFAARATSSVGKLQVEYAQLRYRMPRLLGFGKSLSRTGGGIGTRGPGEKKLETDRRHIQSRMDEIKREIKETEVSRGVQRNKREKSEIPVVALVGYTNAGKSALMNRLLTRSEKEGKSVFEKDMLFATLDVSQRCIKLDSNREFILTDTVGFVSKLPHSLVEAFKSTLEEVLYADLLVQVVDVSSEDCEFNMQVTNSVLKEIGAGDIPMIVAFNKIDRRENKYDIPVTSRESISISAKYDINIDMLEEKICDIIFSNMRKASLLIPYNKGSISSYLCDKCSVAAMEYKDDGTYFEVELNPADYSRLTQYMVR